MHIDDVVKILAPQEQFIVDTHIEETSTQDRREMQKGILYSRMSIVNLVFRSKLVRSSESECVQRYESCYSPYFSSYSARRLEIMYYT